MSVTDVKGFAASGVHCGIKQGTGDAAEGGSVGGDAAPLDLAIIRSDVKGGPANDSTGGWQPLAAAGVFTSNKLVAAPVTVSQQHLAVGDSVGGGSAKGSSAVAVVLNSGNANAATGKQGMEDAKRMCELTAQEVGCETEEVLVCSTGLIGFQMPMDAIESGIPEAVAACSADGGAKAAEAIMTTDTVIKQALVEAGGFSVGGMAKGAAMLQPNMATMLAVLTTDAVASAEMLQLALSEAVKTTFNCLTTDGAQSTNDTVLLLSSAQSCQPESQAELTEAVREVCASLAKQMADDAEGSTKTVTLHVVGAKSDEEAAIAARRCANSQLIKCSWYGCDPYWGRLASECGASNVAFDENTLTISYGEHVVYERGVPREVSETEEVSGTDGQSGIDGKSGQQLEQQLGQTLSEYMSGRQLLVKIDLGQGSGKAEVVTTDLTPGYIAENMRTS